MYVYQNHLKYYNTINVLPGILNICDSKILLLQKCIKNVYRRRDDDDEEI